MESIETVPVFCNLVVNNGSGHPTCKVALKWEFDWFVLEYGGMRSRVSILDYSVCPYLRIGATASKE